MGLSRCWLVACAWHLAPTVAQSAHAPAGEGRGGGVDAGDLVHIIGTPATEDSRSPELDVLEQLLLDSTAKYLEALGAVRDVRQRQHVEADSESEKWPEPVVQLLRELQGELSAILDPAPSSRHEEVVSSPSISQPTAAPLDATDQAIADFNAWFATSLADRSPLRIKAVRDPQFRIGVEATAPISADEVYLAVPPDLVLDARSAAKSPIGDLLADARRLFGRGDSFHELLLHLVHQRFVLGEQSHWWPYLRLLPDLDSLGAPYFLEPAAAEHLLVVSAVLPLVRQQRSDIRRQYEKIVKPLFKKVTAAHHVLEQELTLARYEWATFILNTRSIWWHGERHLVPMLDFVNCRGVDLIGQPLRVHATVADAEGFAITRAPVSWATGHTLFENYGQPNHVYYFYHGFSLEENPHDCLKWPASSGTTTAGRRSLCLDESVILDGAVAARAIEDEAGSSSSATADGSRGSGSRRALLTTLARRLQLYEATDKEKPKEGTGGPSQLHREASARLFVATERRLLQRLIQAVRYALREPEL